jgi:hypothetical protein
MNESVKATLGVIVAACALAGMIAWMPQMTNGVSALTWWFRIGCPILGVICLVPIVWAQTRKDKVPDFLARVTRSYFERDGFCFAVVPQVTANRCAMQIYFQNRYERPCTAQILIRGSTSLFGGRPDLKDIALGVSCGPAEFGCSTIPWPIPIESQGKTVSLSVYAGVKYPNGRGALLRYRDGHRVGAVGADIWREGLQIAGAVVGALVVSRPARLKLALPSGVISSSNGINVETKTIWRLDSSVTSKEPPPLLKKV